MVRHRLVLLLLVIILLAAALARLWALDAASLWWDEGNNAYFAHQNLSEILQMSRATHDTDPPAHRLALGLWLRMLGDSALNLRLFSALLGIATVALVYLWGEWLGGPLAGLLAAALMALSPMAIYYSREAKGYPFVAFLGLLAPYVWARYLLRGERRRRWLWGVYITAVALSVGAHYYAVFLSVAQGTWLTLGALLARRVRRRGSLPGELAQAPLYGRKVLIWLGAQLVAGAPILLWMLLTLSASLEGAMSVSPDRAALGLVGYLREVFLTFAAGPPATDAPGSPRLAAALAACMLGMAALAALWPDRHHGAQRSAGGPPADPHTSSMSVTAPGSAALAGDDRSAGLLLCLLLIPVILGFAVQTRFAFFYPRFLLYALPALLLLAALGLLRLRRIGVVLGVGLVTAWIVVAPTAYAPFAGPEEDIRPAVRVLRALARPGDAVVSSYIWQEGMMRMYAPGTGVSYHLGWFSKRDVEQQVRQLLDEHPRLWLVTYRSPLQHAQNRGGWWLEQHAPRAAVAESGAHRAVLYLAPCAEDYSRSASFELGIHLAYRPVAEQVVAGDPFPLALQWRVEWALPKDAPITVYVHLYDASGKLWAQSDGDAVNGLRPLTAMTPGQPVGDCRALLTAADVPPGRYRVMVGLYRLASGERLKLADGSEAGRDAVTLGEVEILPSPRS